MTGYGKHQFENDLYTIKIEMKTVNSRFLEINFRMPKMLFIIEDRLKNTISEYLKRGKVDVFIELKLKSTEAIEVTVDHALLDKYQKAYDEIRSAVGIEDRYTLHQFTGIPNLISVSNNDPDENDLLKAMTIALENVLIQVNQMREKEGQALKIDILSRLSEIDHYRSQILTIYPNFIDEQRQRLHERIGLLLEDERLIDDGRLEQEIAILLDKKDVSEEMTRIDTHLTQMKSTLESEEPIGRKLDFLCQELNREINTTGSKSSDLEITSLVVELKSILEQVREQVQNLE